MKLTGLTLIVGAIIFLFIAFMPQEEHLHHADDQQRQHMMEMMKNPAMAEMIMEHIAEDGDLRMKMMHKMHAKMHGDGESMMDTCKRMMGDDHQHGAMMHHEKMSYCDKEGKKDDTSHEKHH
jgi:hypothetical protein